MVGVINPNASTSLSHQRDLALAASYQLSPGEPFPSEAETPQSSTLPNGTAVQPPAGTHGGKLSGGVIAGIAVAGIGVLVLGILLAFFWGRLKTLREEIRRKDSTVVRSTELRYTWYLAGSPGAWPSPAPQTQMLSPPYSAVATPASDVGSPMTSHAVPPAYYESPPWSRSTSSSRSPAVGLGLGLDAASMSPSHMSRAASHRSVGGTFDWIPGTNSYARTHEGAYHRSHVGSYDDADPDAIYKYAPPTLTSVMTSPTDPALVPASELQRANRMPEVREGYTDEKGRWVGRHVNREDPAEMADTSMVEGRL